MTEAFADDQTVPDTGVAEDRTYDFEKLRFATPAPAKRSVTITVEASVTDAQLQMAIDLGFHALRVINTGSALVLFAHVVEENGEPVPTIGHMPVALLQPKDLSRLLQMGQAINDVNHKIVQARSAGPANELTANVDGNRAKDNALSELKGQVEGRRGGLVVPTSGGGRK